MILSFSKGKRVIDEIEMHMNSNQFNNWLHKRLAPGHPKNGQRVSKYKIVLIHWYWNKFKIPILLSFYLRQVSGIQYLNQVSTYHLAGGDTEITKVEWLQPNTYFFHVLVLTVALFMAEYYPKKLPS